MIFVDCVLKIEETSFPQLFRLVVSLSYDPIMNSTIILASYITNICNSINFKLKGFYLHFA